MQAYHALERRFARLSRLDGALGILGWDKEAIMPLGAAAERGEQIATLSVMRHELLTAPETAELLQAAEQDEASALDGWQAANLREMRRQHAHGAAVPADLVEAASRAATACEVAWRQARADSDFAGLLPRLAEVLDTQRAVGAAKGAALGLSAYDALLDQYDPGTTQAFVDPIFSRLRDGLPALLAAVTEHQGRLPPPLPLPGPFPVALQRGLGQRLMQAAGFDSNRGRLDVSTHPFCGGATDDVRITTRYDEADFSGALMGVLHETGHALYEQGRPRDWLAQPVGLARGMTMHESQSLLIEMQACRGDAFLGYLATLLRAAFGENPAWDAGNLRRHYRQVTPGPIRVDADEVTYPAHVLLRYELERAMIAGDLALRDLPAAFNDGLRALLGVTVPDDRRGCLQDIHWPGGAWGYFPTYTLGAMTAAQLYRAATIAEPELEAGLASGDFSVLVRWLRRHVHEQGSRTETAALIAQATGQTLDAAIYQAYLRRRYLDQAPG